MCCPDCWQAIACDGPDPADTSNPAFKMFDVHLGSTHDDPPTRFQAHLISGRTIRISEGRAMVNTLVLQWHHLFTQALTPVFCTPARANSKQPEGGGGAVTAGSPLTPPPPSLSVGLWATMAPAHRLRGAQRHRFLLRHLRVHICLQHHHLRPRWPLAMPVIQTAKQCTAPDWSGNRAGAQPLVLGFGAVFWCGIFLTEPPPPVQNIMWHVSPQSLSKMPFLLCQCNCLPILH